MTTPDDPQWSPEEIEAQRNNAPARQPTVIAGIAPVSQAPDLFSLAAEEA